MPQFWESINGAALREDEKLLEKITRKSRPLRGYYDGIYFNSHFGDAQVILYADYDNKDMDEACYGVDTHVCGGTHWRLKVIREDNGGYTKNIMEKRLTVSGTDGTGFAVINVVNSDVLPSYSENEEIYLQVAAFASEIMFFADENEYTEYCNNNDQYCFSLTESECPFPAGYDICKEKADNGEEFDPAQMNATVILGIAKEFRMSNIVIDDGKDLKAFPYLKCIVDTDFGEIEIVYSSDQVPDEMKKHMIKGSVVRCVGTLQGDAAVCRYEEGLIMDKENDLHALAYALETGRIQRLSFIIADEAEYSTYQADTIKGSEAILRKLQLINDVLSIKGTYCYALPAEITSTKNVKEPGCSEGERCLVISYGNPDNHEALMFIDTDEIGRISRINITNDTGYEYRYQCWPESRMNDVSLLDVLIEHAEKIKLISCEEDKQFVLDYILKNRAELNANTEYIRGKLRPVNPDESLLIFSRIFERGAARELTGKKGYEYCGFIDLDTRPEEPYDSFLVSSSQNARSFRKVLTEYASYHSQAENSGYIRETYVFLQALGALASRKTDVFESEDFTSYEYKMKVARAVKRSYETGDFTCMFPYMSDDYEHHSFWVMGPMKGKKTATDYYIGKGKAIRKSDDFAKLTFVKISEPMKRVAPGKLIVNGKEAPSGSRISVWMEPGTLCIHSVQIIDGEEIRVLIIPKINDDGKLTELSITEPSLFSFEPLEDIEGENNERRKIVFRK